ncbi:MAG TPA: hypothetical protein VGP61_02025 [Gemmatimonadales bacterium]|nr:hypothetical protein [Gemmatimonadales bacterium]
MSQPPADNVRAMRLLCKDIEGAIARGELPRSVVADLKGAIDDTRMRVWASMEAAKSGDPSWVQEFWLHRAAEVCLSMVKRLEEGELDSRSPRATALRAAAGRLAASLGSGGPE